MPEDGNLDLVRIRIRWGSDEEITLRSYDRTIFASVVEMVSRLSPTRVVEVVKIEGVRTT